MSEHTFLGRYDATRREVVDPEFFEVGLDLIESEKLTDSLYRIMIDLMAEDGWLASTRQVFASNGLHGPGWDIIQAYKTGFYIPCVKRTILSGQIDLMNDKLPDRAGIVIQTKTGNFEFAAAGKIGKLPKGYIQTAKGTNYLLVHMWSGDVDRASRRFLGDRVKQFHTSCVTVKSCGSIVPVVEAAHRRSSMVELHANRIWMVAGAINAEADARNLWNVATRENLVTEKHPTELRLGVSEEHVKSLFYARTLPLTDSGRKRPILHWVAAHKRRLEKGIDVDVSKHLRGITSFVMDSLPFAITNPPKPAAKINLAA